MSDNCHACGAPFRHRSSASHAHFFAALNERYETMPEEVTERLPSLDHFRRFCLIRTGWRDERSIACASQAEARRVAAFVRPMDEFAIVTVHGATVIVWTARSQSSRAMGREAFQRSKDDVLAYADSLLGVNREAA